jgi:thioredoxin-like negative regulator of GroEL
MKEIYRFTASWCNPCKTLTKQLEAKGLFIPGCDVDDEATKPLLEQFEVRSVPTVVVVTDGQVQKFVGAALTQQMFEALVS